MNLYALSYGTLGGLLCVATAQAQAPALIGVFPPGNALAAPRNTVVAATFSQPLTAASAGALKVFSNQRGGLRSSGRARVAGTTLTFSPIAYDFQAGETVQLSVTRDATGTGGPLAQPWVGQFTVETGGTGRGYFGGGSLMAVTSGLQEIAAGDVDGDGDLDFVAVGSGGTASVRLNNGAGVFAGGQSLTTATGGYSVTLADLDGDGDLDFVAGSVANLSCPVFFNNGSGGFVAGQSVAVASSAYEVVLADLDGDGDNDLVVAQSNSSEVTLFPNSGAGTFGAGLSFPIGPYGTPSGVVVGDVNSDGRPDIVAQESSNTVAVLLNAGAGTFVAAPSVTVGLAPRRLLLADLDGDHDLDLLTADQVDNTVGVRFNQPTGPLATAPAAAPAALTAAPNPATGRVRLSLPAAATSAELLDALGRPVRQVPAMAGTATLDTSGLPPGLYLLRAAGHTARLQVE